MSWDNNTSDQGLQYLSRDVIRRQYEQSAIQFYSLGILHGVSLQNYSTGIWGAIDMPAVAGNTNTIYSDQQSRIICIAEISSQLLKSNPMVIAIVLFWEDDTLHLISVFSELDPKWMEHAFEIEEELYDRFPDTILDFQITKKGSTPILDWAPSDSIIKKVHA